MRTHVCIAILGSIIGSTIFAQEPKADPRYFDTRYLNSHSKLTLQTRFVFGLEASFSNLGELDYPVDTDEDEDGVFIDYLFSDGYIDLIDTDSLYTSDFQFQMVNAEMNHEGFVESFTLNQYRSTPSLEEFIDEGEVSSGWELAYQYEWGTRSDKFRFGILAGFALNSAEYSVSETVTGDLYVQSAQVVFDNPQITYIRDGVYTGSTDGPSIHIEDDMEFDQDQESLVVQDVWQVGEVIVPSEVDASADLDVVITNFRLGPTLTYKITDRLHFQGSAGLNLTYVYQDVAVQESMEYLLNIGVTQVFSTDNHTDWLGGYYVDGTFYYYINERTAAYGSLQAFRTDNPNPSSSEGVKYKINLKNNIVFSFGLQLSF